MEYKRNVLTKFVTYVDRIFNALGLGSELNGTDVLQIEKSIIRNMACYIETEPKKGKKEHVKKIQKRIMEVYDKKNIFLN